MSDMSNFTRIILGDTTEEMAEGLRALQVAGVMLFEVKFTQGAWIAFTWRGHA